MERISKCILVLFLWGAFGSIPAYAVTFNTPAGSTSAAGVPVSFAATLDIVGDTLTLTLENNSLSTLNRADVLSSLYFDIFNSDGVTRPDLVYASATGDVYGVKPGNNNDGNASALPMNTWDFKAMDDAFPPNLGFGIGAVGNAMWPPNNFDGGLVDGVDYAIYYDGEITTNSFKQAGDLVKHTATFTFDIDGDDGEYIIGDAVVFGLGTTPDSYIYVPAPVPVVLLGSALLCLIGVGGLRKKISR